MAENLPSFPFFSSSSPNIPPHHIWKIGIYIRLSREDDVHSGVHAEMHPGMHTQAHTGTHTQMHAGMHAQMHAGMHAQMHAGMHAQMHAGMHAQIHSETHVRMAGTESESITNQRSIVREHIASLQDGDEYRIIQEYIDEGISGTTDDRRGQFQAMLRDIEKGRINCVIVKDLARSFRNYSDQGYYLEDWFPRHNVRFISLSHQPLDSYREPSQLSGIAVPIQGVLNENHCAETSAKVRQVFDNKRRNGLHIGSFALYGYQKDPLNKNALIIDPEAAEVVRSIFSLFLEGCSRNAIVRSLNEEGILCPSRYKRERQGLLYANPAVRSGTEPLWSAAAVSNILKNPMYCGDMVQGRFRIKSYKIHQQEKLPPDQWFYVKNTHEPIVSRDVFLHVQRLLGQSIRTRPGQDTVPLFGGLLRCADCRRAMSRSPMGGHIYYYCRTYKDRSRTACTRHTLRHDNLEKAVSATLQLLFFACIPPEQNRKKLPSCLQESSRKKHLSAALLHNNRQQEKLARYRRLLYQDWKDGQISREDYLLLKEDYEKEAAALLKAREHLEKEKIKAEDLSEEAALETDGDERPLILTRPLLTLLVESITVYEGRRISLKLRFSSPWSQLLRQEKEEAAE